MQWKMLGKSLEKARGNRYIYNFLFVCYDNENSDNINFPILVYMSLKALRWELEY